MASDFSRTVIARLYLMHAAVSKKRNALHNGRFGNAHTQLSDCAVPNVADVGLVLFPFIYPLMADTLSVDAGLNIIIYNKHNNTQYA